MTELFSTNSGLNPAQQEAVNTRQGHWACLAGPGSGKTHVLIARYVALRQEGVPASDILCLTFTNKAAAEMRARAEKALKGSSEKSTGRPSGFCTFHALGLAFANLERDHFPFPLAPQPLASEGQIAKYLGIASRRYQIPYKELVRFVSEQKRLGLTPADVLAMDAYRQRAREAYRDYDSMMRKNGLLDFDDLITCMVSVLREKADVLDRWQFKFVCIDEAQDADQLQWELVKLLSFMHENVFAVGDVNQCIFEFRAAHPKLFLNFHEMFPGAKYLYLGQNFRSSPQVVSFIKQVAPVKNELLDHFHSTNEHGPEPKITSYASCSEEAEKVIASYQANSLGTVAILARTNAYLLLFENLCMTKGLRYHLLGKSGFWNQPEVKNVLAYCQIAHSPYDSAVMAALRAPFHPSRFINRRDLQLAWETHDGPSYWELLRDYRPENEQQAKAIEGFSNFIYRVHRYGQELTTLPAITQIIQDLRAIEYYQDEEENPDNDPVANLRQLIKIAERFSGLGDFLAYCRKMIHASRRTTGLALGTIHSAKGLEFDTVFVTGCQEGMLPHEKATNLDEEARILFVAVSRPARHLFISFVGQPSRFLTTVLK